MLIVICPMFVHIPDTRKYGQNTVREYCFGEENSLSLTEFWGKLGEFCEKLVKAKKLTEIGVLNRTLRNRIRPSPRYKYNFNAAQMCTS